MMDPYGGTGQSLWTIVASDGGSWSWGQLSIDWLQQDSLIYSIPQFIAAKTLILMMFSFTLDIYCTSVHPGRGIPPMWLSLRFLLSFYPVFFCSFSLLLLRVKGRGCHTLLKPYKTNCGLWIWAIQIKFDWLMIDSPSPWRRCALCTRPAFLSSVAWSWCRHRARCHRASTCSTSSGQITNS